VLIELGTAQGNTVANIAHFSPATTIYTVNAPAEAQTGVMTTFSLSPEEIGYVYRKYGFGNRITQIYANTLHLDLSKYLAQGSVDIGIIDACHDSDYVVNDFYKLHPYIRPGGIILFHDTHPSMRDHLIGSYVGCVLLRREGFDIQHLAGTWWGILKKSDTQVRSGPAWSTTLLTKLRVGEIL
jgi:hypothetical protein